MIYKWCDGLKVSCGKGTAGIVHDAAVVIAAVCQGFRIIFLLKIVLGISFNVLPVDPDICVPVIKYVTYLAGMHEPFITCQVLTAHAKFLGHATSRAL